METRGIGNDAANPRVRMIGWPPGPARGGRGYDQSANANDHPDFNGKIHKRRLLTPADYNSRAEREGWGSRVHPDLTFVQPELRTLRDLWFEIQQKKGAMPARTDFDAKTLKPFLSHIGIIDCIPQEKRRSRYRIRLQGDELTRLFGEQAGRFIDEYLPRQSLERWEMGYDVAIDFGRPVRFTQKFVLPLLSHLDGEAFSAPLAAEDNAARGLLTALYVRPKAGVIAETG